MTCRPLVGRFRLTSRSEFEFEPSTLAEGQTVVYPCEFVNLFGSFEIFSAVSSGEYVVVVKWHWIQCNDVGVIVVDAHNVSFNATREATEDVGEAISEKIVAISALLRIKNETDPFHNSFVVHLNSGKRIICRNGWMRYFWAPSKIFAMTDLKRIKLKTSSSTLVAYLEGPESKSVLTANTTDEQKGCTMLLGRVIEINSSGFILATNNNAVSVRANAWAQCDPRRIGVGAFVSVCNYHSNDDSNVVLCPCGSFLVIHELPPVGGPYFPLYQLAQRNSVHKFSINSLCQCDCQLKSHDLANADTLFLNALKAAELRLSIHNAIDLFHFKAPPFFNVSITTPLHIVPRGPPDAAVSQFLKKLPKTLYLGLFPPNKPLNAYTLVQFSNNGPLVLVSRDFKFTDNVLHSISQLLVIETNQSAPVHAIILNQSTLIPLSEFIRKEVISAPPESVNQMKQNRRSLLTEKMDKFGLHLPCSVT